MVRQEPLDIIEEQIVRIKRGRMTCWLCRGFPAARRELLSERSKALGELIREAAEG